MIETERGYKLTTGTEIYANCGILGISPRGITEGYDGDIDADLTPEERKEVAAFAIAQWQAWIETGNQGP